MNDEKATDCPDAEVIYSFIDGLLGGSEADRCGEHVAACTKCSTLVEEARGSKGLIDQLRKAEPSDDEQRAIVKGTEQLLRTLQNTPGRSTPR